MSSQGPIVVAGMHRSGTSLISSVLAAMHVDMGHDTLVADRNNVRGYFEDIEFLELHRRVLNQCSPNDDGGHPDWGWTENERLDRDSFKDFIPEAKALLARRAENPSVWGWKDPRTSLLLDFWDALLDNGRYVFVYRFPWDVADSMQRLGEALFLRHPEYAYDIWMFYNRHLRNFLLKNRHKCLLISVNALQRHPDQLCDLLHQEFGLNTSDVDLKEIFESDLMTSSEATDPLIDLVAATYPDCARMLTELDGLADLSGSGLWQARPVVSRCRTAQSAHHNQSPVDVSIIIPCCDDGQFLIEAIASVERVAPDNCELIIVNDGSNHPRTLAILRTLKQCGYFILDQAHQGLSAARNAGIELASGRYILPLDADNRARAGFIEDAVRVLDTSHEVGVVYGYRQFFGTQRGIDDVPEFDFDELLTFNYIDACAVFRKQVWIDCGGYDQTVSPCEDWELWINASAKGWRFQRLPQITFDYRVRPGSLLSLTDDVAFLEAILERIITKHYELYQPRLVKQLVRMKRSCAHQTRRLNRISEEHAEERERLTFDVQVLTRRIGAANEETQSLTAELDKQAQILKSMKSRGAGTEQ